MTSLLGFCFLPSCLVAVWMVFVLKMSDDFSIKKDKNGG